MDRNNLEQITGENEDFVGGGIDGSGFILLIIHVELSIFGVDSLMPVVGRVPGEFFSELCSSFFRTRLIFFVMYSAILTCL